MYIVIDTDNNFKLSTRRLDYKRMQEEVGGYIEFVPTTTFPDDIYMICNENGKLLGLPVNHFASANYRSVDDLVVGNVMFVKRRGEDVVSLDMDDVELIANAHELFILLGEIFGKGASYFG